MLYYNDSIAVFSEPVDLSLKIHEKQPKWVPTLCSLSATFRPDVLLL